MTGDIFWVIADRNSASDDSLFIHSINCNLGDEVLDGQMLFEVEGAKAIFEIPSPIRGYFYALTSSGARVGIGDPLAIISALPIQDFKPEKYLKEKLVTDSNSMVNSVVGNAVFTEKALGFLNRFTSWLSWCPTSFESSLIKEVDIKRYFTSRTEMHPIHSEISRVVIIGGGQGARVLYHSFSEDVRLKIVGVLDSKNNTLETVGVPLLGALNQRELEATITSRNVDALAISVSSDMRLREEYLDFSRKHNIALLSVISNRAFYSSSIFLGQGVIALDSSRIGLDAFIGDNVFLSAFVNIEHGCIIGDNTTFGPGVYLSGDVIVGRNCVFGSNIAVEPRVVIGDNCIIASGSIITHDIPPNSILKSNLSFSRRDRD